MVSMRGSGTGWKEIKQEQNGLQAGENRLVRSCKLTLVKCFHCSKNIKKVIRFWLWFSPPNFVFKSLLNIMLLKGARIFECLKALLS